MDWWRAYHGMPFDTKLAVVAKRANARRGDVAAIWTACLDHASQCPDRGSVEAIDAEEIAIGFDYEVEMVEAVLSAFRDKGLIREDGRLAGWDRRQVKREDGAAERSRAWRERKKSPETSESDEANASERSETHPNANERQIRTEEIREEKKRSKKEGGAAAPPASYAFVGHVGKVKQSDLDQWASSYHAVPDIIAELRAADAYYAEHPPPDGKWFFPFSNWLKREHDKRMAERTAAKRQEELLYRGVL
jgi:hypothetical protein